MFLGTGYDNCLWATFLMASDPISSAPVSRASFPCSLCNNIAGIVEILPPGHPQSLSKENGTIRISGFIGEERIVLSKSAEVALQRCLAAADALSLFNVERLWAPFYCPSCARVYCIKHWTVVPEYDEDFFDHSHGYCPKGHRRLIED
jgi:hypothetical protein